MKADQDPDRLSFRHVVRIVRRKLSAFSAIRPSAEDGFHDKVLDEVLQGLVVSTRNRRLPRGVKRIMSNFAIRRKTYTRPSSINIANAIQIVR